MSASEHDGRLRLGAAGGVTEERKKWINAKAPRILAN